MQLLLFLYECLSFASHSEDPHVSSIFLSLPQRFYENISYLSNVLPDSNSSVLGWSLIYHEVGRSTPFTYILFQGRQYPTSLVPT